MDEYTISEITEVLGAEGYPAGEVEAAIRCAIDGTFEAEYADDSYVLTGDQLDEIRDTLRSAAGAL